MGPEHVHGRKGQEALTAPLRLPRHNATRLPSLLLRLPPQQAPRVHQRRRGHHGDCQRRVGLKGRIKVEAAILDHGPHCAGGASRRVGELGAVGKDANAGAAVHSLI